MPTVRSQFKIERGGERRGQQNGNSNMLTIGESRGKVKWVFTDFFF